MPSILGTTGAQQAEVTAGNIQGALPTTVIEVLSKEIIFYALPKFLYMQFARRQTELNRNPGDTISIHRYDPLRKGKKLTEGVNIEPKTMSASPVKVKVDEYGNAVRLTERLLRTSVFDQLLIAAEQLGDDYAYTTEVEFVTTLMALRSVLFANNQANRAALLATDSLSARTIRAAVEIQKNKLVPAFKVANPFGGGQVEVYICFVNPHQARTLREDPEYKEDVRPNHATRIFMGEIGMYEKVVFIETTMIPVIETGTGDIYINSENFSDPLIVDDPIAADVAPVAFDVHTAFLFGDWTYGFAEALPVELRDDPPEDLGRKRKLGWYSIQGSALVNSDHGMRIETA